MCVAAVVLIAAGGVTVKLFNNNTNKTETGDERRNAYIEMMQARIDAIYEDETFDMYKDKQFGTKKRMKALNDLKVAQSLCEKGDILNSRQVLHSIDTSVLNDKEKRHYDVLMSYYDAFHIRGKTTDDLPENTNINKDGPVRK